MTRFHRWDVSFAATPAAAARAIVSSVMAVSACATTEDLPNDGPLPDLDAATATTAAGAHSSQSRGGATWSPPSGGAGAGGGLAASGAPTVSGDGGASAGGQLSDSGAECPAGLKRCGGLCVPPNPGIGCGLEGCEPCPLAPEGAHRTCEGTSCSYECTAGFERSPDATACIEHVVVGAGGAGGPLSDDGGSSRGGAPSLLDAGGAGGSPAGGGGSTSGCVPSLCTVTSPYAMPCCTSFGSCGCVYVGGIFCSPC